MARPKGALDGGVSRTRTSTGLRWGEGHIKERERADGSVRYQARWYEPQPGGRDKLVSRSFGTRDEAEDYLRQMARDKRDARYVSTTGITVERVVRDYLARGKSRWKASTYATYRQRADTHILPALGPLRLVELTTARVQHWMDRLGSQIGAKTIEDTARVLNGAMSDAVRLGLIPTNPVTNTRGPSSRQTAQVTWSADDIARVLEATTRNAKYHALYHVALTTGMRPGEIRALQWPDVDLTERTITVRRTITRDELNREIVGTTTKTGRVRTVAIPETTARTLRRWKAAQAEEQLAAGTWDSRQFVFTGDGGKFLGSTTWQHRHTEAIRRAGVVPISLHGMRHSFATAMMAQGVHPLIVSRVLGHSKIETTLNVYSHPDDVLQRTAIDAFALSLPDAGDATTSGEKHVANGEI